MRRRRIAMKLALLPAVLVLATACGSSGGVTNGVPVGEAYAGPLAVSRADSEHPSARAAGNVVACDTWGRGGYYGGGVYREGATATSAEKALETARGEGGYGGVQTGLTVARDEGDRVLYVVRVEDAVKQAVIVRNGEGSKGAGGDGWFVESWAMCDEAELPRSYADAVGLQVWSDADGRVVPTTTVQARRGPAHCDWESMTFLELGGDATYVRKPAADLAGYFAGTYRAYATLPADAVDTGYRRDGTRLWTSPDGTRAYVGNPDDVEVWPRTTKPVLCH